MSAVHPTIATSMAWFAPKTEPIERDDPRCFVRNEEYEEEEDEPDMPATIGRDDQPNWGKE